MLTCRVPAGPLSSYVRVLWHAAGWQPSRGRERHLPDGTASMLIVLEGAPRGHADDLAIIVGPRSSYSLIGASAARTIIGVQFTSRGAGPWVNVPLSELANTHAPLRYVADSAATVLRERLLARGSAERRLDLLEEWLTLRLLRQPSGTEAIAWAVHAIEQRPQIHIGDVAERSGHSWRWFVERFSREVGLTPKVFSRLCRFQNALACLHADRAIDLADVAVSLGYFDQAHFAHDFHTIAGITPTAYRAARTVHHNHVAIVD
jgi:AraC-like DNA-binding protein